MDIGDSMFIVSGQVLEPLLTFQFVQIHKEFEGFGVGKSIRVIDPLRVNHFADR